jgi:hypothetical protein
MFFVKNEKTRTKTSEKHLFLPCKLCYFILDRPYDYFLTKVVDASSVLKSTLVITKSCAGLGYIFKATEGLDEFL